MLNITKKVSCTGCEACANICSTQAISMKSDNEGFLYPLIHRDKCISCGMCEQLCPNLNEIERKNTVDPQVYAAWSLDEEIRLNSTSGGIFSELAKVILEEDGYICGAVYNDEYMVEHYITDCQEGLIRIRQSKYVQSVKGTIYRQVGKLLADGKKVLFCGAPCECEALVHYLILKNIMTENLLLIDFICRGASSPKVYRKYLDDLERQYHSKIKKVWFKNKTYGWNQFSTKIEFENGTYYLAKRADDLYVKGYIELNLYIRPSCSECKYKGFPRVSDITLADFWGVELKDKTKDIENGTSMVVLNSETGEAFFNKIQDRIFCEKATVEMASNGNYCMYNSVLPGKYREVFMHDLDRMDFIQNIQRFI